jgi:hypothetical protein
VRSGKSMSVERVIALRRRLRRVVDSSNRTQLRLDFIPSAPRSVDIYFWQHIARFRDGRGLAPAVDPLDAPKNPCTMAPDEPTLKLTKCPKLLPELWRIIVEWVASAGTIFDETPTRHFAPTSQSPRSVPWLRHSFLDDKGD